jgi:hypothetical protein
MRANARSLPLALRAIAASMLAPKARRGGQLH